MPYLTPYIGTWTATEARQLLRRTTFGPSQAMVDNAVSLGKDATLDQLFLVPPIPDPPLKDIPDGTGSNALDDPWVLYGETWVNAPPFPNVNPPMYRNRILRYRSKSLYAWTLLQMQYEDISLMGKMWLFWHNHFVVGQSVIPHREYHYYLAMRNHALGSFKQMTKDITIDTNMLLYLSGAENTNNSPNENYSRELLELFTIGKGDLIATGDYSNYTEDDVIEMAKALTGWRVFQVGNPDTLTADFQASRHTTGDKFLSYHFNNAVITENGADEYSDLIDVIFQQDECSRFIMRKLYRWFVNSDITPDIETNIIEPLALILRNDDYQVANALRTLLASEHFFLESTACMIKNPVDLLFSVTRGLDAVPPTTDLEEEYEYAYHIYIMARELEQGLYQHPDVAGWKAYYQAPQYYKTWINNLLLPKRHEYCLAPIMGATVSVDGDNYNIPAQVPVLDIAANIPNALDPNILVETLANRLFAYPITAGQITALKEVLIDGLPDFEWTLEYGNYLADPTDTALALSVENKLKNLLTVMVQMSEFQIM